MRGQFAAEGVKLNTREGGQMAERNKVIMAADIIGNQREIVIFLRDVAGATEDITPEGFEGLSQILEHVNEGLMQAFNLLQAQYKGEIHD